MKYIKAAIISIAAFFLVIGVAAAAYPATFTAWTVGDKITSAWLNTIEQMIGTGSTSTPLTTQVGNVSGTVVRRINGIATSSVLFSANGTGLSVASSGFSVTYTIASSSYLQPGNNLSEITNSSTATTNLGALRGSQNLSDLQSSSTARVNILSTGAGLNQSATGTVSLAPPVSVPNGGTGTSTLPADSQVLSANGTSSAWKNIAAGSNITISTSTTAITINAAGASNPMGRLGRTVSSQATTGTLSITNMAAREYLEGYISMPTGSTANIALGLRFNGDSAAHYGDAQGNFNGSPVSVDSRNAGTLINLTPNAIAAGNAYSVYFKVYNTTTTAKLVDIVMMRMDTTLNTAPAANHIFAVWGTTTSTITQVDLVNASSSGSIATGTVMAVYGSAD